MQYDLGYWSQVTNYSTITFDTTKSVVKTMGHVIDGCFDKSCVPNDQFGIPYSYE